MSPGVGARPFSLKCGRFRLFDDDGRSPIGTGCVYICIERRDGSCNRPVSIYIYILYTLVIVYSCCRMHKAGRTRPQCS